MTIGGVTDPGEIERRYDDIERILKGKKVTYKTYETKSESGNFKSYVVETG